MFDDNEFDGFTLGELLAEADAIGRKYQSQEEIEDYQACLDGATEALEDTLVELGFHMNRLILMPCWILRSFK